MKKYALTLALLTTVLLVSAPLHAAQKSANNAAAAQQKAAAEARAKADAEAQKKAEEHYNALHPQLPHITVSELKNMSAADLRALYQKSYEAQGMKWGEAKQKAAALNP